MPCLNEDQRSKAIGRLQAGETQTYVATSFYICQVSTTLSIRDLPRSDRPRMTTDAQDRYITVCEIASATFTTSSILDGIESQIKQSETVCEKLG